MREIKFRAWTGLAMVYGVMAGHFTHTPIMQFTGLLDKNGKEIYESDICLIGDSGFAKPMKITFQDGCFGVLWEKEHFAALMNYVVYPSCEVIGNLYENPDLLETP